MILEEIHASGCNAGACHAQMYIMGTLLRHGNEEQKQTYLPDIATGRPEVAGIRRHRADHGFRHHEAEDRAVRDGDRYIVNGQKVWTSRALQSDMMLLLARTTSVSR